MKFPDCHGGKERGAEILEFTLKQLEVFAAVVDQEGFGRAADQLYLAQSTVSAHIRGLEAALGVPLFRRDTRRKPVLTAEGQKM